MDYKYMPFNYDGSYLAGRYYWPETNQEMKEFEKMMELFPENIEYIRQYVMDEADRLEYEGSLMYDEYPDKLGLRMIVNRIYETLRENGNYDEIFGNSDVKDVIFMVLICEMYKRRSNRRRMYPMFYMNNRGTMY